MKSNPTMFATAFAVIFILSARIPESKAECSRTCAAENCDSVTIRYGKYCGVGNSGCAGEAPCDEVDACCKIHDECTTQFGAFHETCHEEFKDCIIRADRFGDEGFSDVCPYSTIVPTMAEGIDSVLLVSDLAAKFNFVKGLLGG